MEFGPRALGARSILGDARNPEMQSRMNLKIKYRESFRPFAPSVLREYASEVFENGKESPYMLLVTDVRPGPPARDDCRRAAEERDRSSQGAPLRRSGDHPTWIIQRDCKPSTAKRIRSIGI
jgi:hypothetical protein